MKLGTSNFVGSRLREAREARALTVVALANLLDMTRQAIAQYEEGSKTPSPAVMKRLTQILDFPLAFFLAPILPERRGAMFYRSMSSATKVARNRAERRFDWYRRIVAYIQQYAEFPLPRFPDVSDLPTDPSFIDYAMIENVAIKARRFWNLSDGPISNVVWLLENNGAHIVRHELIAETLDAFSEWSEDYKRPFIVLGTDKGSACRSRFDAAHELGHMLLHRNIPEEVIRNTAKFKAIEDQAHYFAGAFLLPAKAFAAEFVAPSLDVFHSMKARWKVSIAAMIKRAENLELLQPDQITRLWINLTRRGWKSSEPLDNVIECEQPRFMRRAIDLLITNRVITPEELSANLFLRIRDIEDACGLRPDDLSGQEAPTIRITAASASSQNNWPKSASSGNWIFPINKT